LWYCKCRKFRTQDFDELRKHIEGIDDDEDGTYIVNKPCFNTKDLLVLGMIAGIGISAGAVSYYLNFNWKLIGSTAANVFLIPFAINKFLNWRKNKRSLENSPKTDTINAEYERIRQELDDRIGENS
jgi:hypothetical protein